MTALRLLCYVGSCLTLQDHSTYHSTRYRHTQQRYRLLCSWSSIRHQQTLRSKYQIHQIHTVHRHRLHRLTNLHTALHINSRQFYLLSHRHHFILLSTTHFIASITAVIRIYVFWSHYITPAYVPLPPSLHSHAKPASCGGLCSAELTI